MSSRPVRPARTFRTRRTARTRPGPAARGGSAPPDPAWRAAPPPRPPNRRARRRGRVAVYDPETLLDLVADGLRGRWMPRRSERGAGFHADVQPFTAVAHR